jgi:hypothetical protein
MEIGQPLKRHTVVPLKEPIPHRTEPSLPAPAPTSPARPTTIPERVDTYRLA